MSSEQKGSEPVSGSGKEYIYHKVIQYHETDSMGVVHHSNYLRYWEEARVGWLRHTDLMREHAPASDLTFAVLESSCQHLLPCRFGDEILIRLQVRKERAKMRLRYAAHLAENAAELREAESDLSEHLGPLIATGHTLHIALDGQLRVCRIPNRVRQKLESEEWTETWP